VLADSHHLTAAAAAVAAFTYRRRTEIS